MEARCFCEHCGLERLEVRDWLRGGGPPSTSARISSEVDIFSSVQQHWANASGVWEYSKLKIVQNVNFNFWNKKFFSEEDESTFK